MQMHSQTFSFLEIEKLIFCIGKVNTVLVICGNFFHSCIFRSNHVELKGERSLFSEKPPSSTDIGIWKSWRRQHSLINTLEQIKTFIYFYSTFLNKFVFLYISFVYFSNFVFLIFVIFGYIHKICYTHMYIHYHTHIHINTYHHTHISTYTCLYNLILAQEREK